MRSEILLGSRSAAGSEASRNTGLRWPEGDLPRESIISFNSQRLEAHRLQVRLKILAFWYRNSYHSRRRCLDFDHCVRPPNAAACENAAAWSQANWEHRPMHAEVAALAGVAVALTLDDGRLSAFRAALTGTNSRPFAPDGTDDLIGKPLSEPMTLQIKRPVYKQVQPMRPTIVSAKYRRLAATGLACRLFRQLVTEPDGTS
jgi:xanthine dehydrogenase iron-sulfur cluster and FAD-binding subunit A